MHKGSINVSAQESGFKIFSRCITRCSECIKFPPQYHPTAGDVRILMVHYYISYGPAPTSNLFENKFTVLPLIEISPAQMLLHHSKIPKSRYHKSLALHLLNAAKMCIPALWKDTSPPKY